MVGTVTDVTPELLRQRGIEAVMVDLDDTLVASDSSNISPSYKVWLDAFRTNGMPVMILSNGHIKRVRYWSTELGVEGFALVGKPFAFAFWRGLKVLGKKPKQTAMIGDQLFTDVLGANMMGMTSILVEPLSEGGLPHTRLARKLETWLLGGDRGSSFDR